MTAEIETSTLSGLVRILERPQHAVLGRRGGADRAGRSRGRHRPGHARRRPRRRHRAECGRVLRTGRAGAGGPRDPPGARRGRHAGPPGLARRRRRPHRAVQPPSFPRTGRTRVRPLPPLRRRRGASADRRRPPAPHQRAPGPVVWRRPAARGHQARRHHAAPARPAGPLRWCRAGRVPAQHRSAGRARRRRTHPPAGGVRAVYLAADARRGHRQHRVGRAPCIKGS